MIEQNYRDTTPLIFDYLYLVRVPVIQFTTVDYMKKYGNYITGDAGIDNDAKRQPITTMLSIAKMVSLFQQGSQISVVNYNDTKEIYSHISEHLAAWKQQLTYGVNIGSAPIDDLIAMDEFANSIYEFAKYQFTRDTVSSILASHMHDMAGISPQNFFKPGTQPTQEGQVVSGINRVNEIKEGPSYDERDQMGDFFKDRLTGLRTWR